ncbi:MAG: TetR/AcrR family transcriptional regulator [Pseudomonadota bacterium]
MTPPPKANPADTADPVLAERLPRAVREQPVQARARQTVDTILAAAADLLSDVGWEGFNTNLLAERAGCRVATIYRYFPDKLAIVSTLAEAMVAQWDREVSDFGAALEAAGDMRLAWTRSLAKFMASVEAQPGALAVRRAMQATPELRAIDQADNERLAAGLSAVLAGHVPGLSRLRAQAAARMLIESAVAVIDLAYEAPAPEAKRLLAELEAMHTAYFDWLGAPRPVGPPERKRHV